MLARDTSALPLPRICFIILQVQISMQACMSEHSNQHITKVINIFASSIPFLLYGKPHFFKHTSECQLLAPLIVNVKGMFAHITGEVKGCRAV